MYVNALSKGGIGGKPTTQTFLSNIYTTQTFIYLTALFLGFYQASDQIEAGAMQFASSTHWGLPTIPNKNKDS